MNNSAKAALVSALTAAQQDLYDAANNLGRKKSAVLEAERWHAEAELRVRELKEALPDDI